MQSYAIIYYAARAPFFVYFSLAIKVTCDLFNAIYLYSLITRSLIFD